MKKPILLFIFLILLSSFALGAQITQISSGDVGLDIRYPAYLYTKQNTAFTLYTSIYNRSDGLMLTNATVECHLKLFDSDGSRTLSENLGYDAVYDDFKLSIDANNFSNLGFHAYIIKCNTSTIGGFVSGVFEVTESGKVSDNLDSTSGIAIVIFILFVTSLFLLLPIIKEPLSQNKFLNVIFKRGCWIIGLLLLTLNSAMMATIASEAFIPLSSNFLRIYVFLFSWSAYLLIVFTVIKTIFDLMGMWQQDKMNKRVGDD